MHGCGGQQILAPRYQRHALQCVIMGGAEMIAERRVLAGQHHVSKHVRRRTHPTLPFFVKSEPADPAHRGRQIQPPCMRLPGCHTLLPLRRGPGAAGAGVGCRLRAMRGGERDGGAGAEAGVEKPETAQLVESGLIVRAVLGLPARPVPDQPERGQVLQESGGILWPAARRVDIFDPQQEPPTGVLRPGPRGQRGISVA